MPVLASSRVAADPAVPAPANLATAPLPSTRPGHLLQAERPHATLNTQDTLADWQVALLLGGSAVWLLATGIAALFGLSLLL